MQSGNQPSSDSDKSTTDPSSTQSFEQQAGQQRESLVTEFIHFLKEEKKWWLAPILVVLAGVTALVLLAGSGAAPFIYTLF